MASSVSGSPAEPMPMEDPREIAKWANRYAKSRTIPFLIQWVFIVLLAVVLAGMAYLTMTAYRTDDTMWFLVSAASIVVMIVVLAWFIAPRWGGERIYRISQWVYGEEGYAAYLGGNVEEDITASRWVYVVGIGLVLYHLTGALLIASRHLALEHMQPFSALYMVPFFVAMSISQRLGFWAFIWPLLYGLHAVLILAGAPLRFTSVNLEMLNMILPVFGYGLVALVVGHVYSRYALHRLKGVVRKGLEAGAEEAEET